jgi:hypothetical protein
MSGRVLILKLLATRYMVQICFGSFILFFVAYKALAEWLAEVRSSDGSEYDLRYEFL